MANKRIYQVAKELNISHNRIIKFLEGIDVKVKNHMMPVDDKVYDSILLEFSKEKKQVERKLKERARKAIVETKDVETKENKNINPTIDTEVIEEVVKVKKEDEKIADTHSEDIGKSEIQEPSKDESSNIHLKKINISEIADKVHKTNKMNQSNMKMSIHNSLTSLKKKSKKRIKKKNDVSEIVQVDGEKKNIRVPEFTSVDELSKLMKIESQDVIMKCIELGLMVTINQRLDMDTLTMVADEFGFNVETLDIYTETEEDDDYADAEQLDRAPVVTIMGHVDHGKTSLLDYIRETNVIAGESGGITQHIGAYEVEVKDKKITFIDTPGHQAFTAMRARGAQVTDIVILIVAADDGVMPQTIEAIDHAKAASVPIIIAINKIDKPGADSEKIKKQLSEHKILVEDWGGKYQCSELSAKSGQGIEDLIDKILIESELLDLKAAYAVPAKGIVIESKLDKGQGAKATVLIQQGTLRKSDIFICGSQFSKVRELFNERNQKIKEAFPSDPVQILGFPKVPNAGEIFKVYEDDREAKKIAQERSVLEREAVHQMHSRITLEQVGKEISSGKVHDLNILIKGDVDGSIEALSDSLMQLSNDEVNIKIVLRSVGMVTENDVQLAAASNAVIVCFNVRSTVNSKKMARDLGVQIRHYSIIYEAIEEIKLALEGLLEPDIVEKSIGEAEVRELFKIPKIGLISGCHVIKGKVIKNSLLRLKRDNEIIYEGKLTSLKRFKDDVTEVLENFDCGIGIDNFKEYKINDIIEVYELNEVKRKLK